MVITDTMETEIDVFQDPKEEFFQIEDELESDSELANESQDPMNIVTLLVGIGIIAGIIVYVAVRRRQK